MRMTTCRLPEGGAIVVQARDRARVFRGGDRVDLDEVAVPAAEDRAALTWAEVLGPHVADHFAIAPASEPAIAAATDASVAHDEE